MLVDGELYLNQTFRLNVNRLGKRLLSQSNYFSCSRNTGELIADLEQELEQLIQAVKTLTFSRRMEDRGRLSLTCERVERLLELLGKENDTQAIDSLELSQTSIAYIQIEAHALLARARTLAATSLCRGSVEGNVIHLKRDDKKIEQQAHAHMLAALDIDALLMETANDSVTIKPKLSLVHSND